MVLNNTINFIFKNCSARVKKAFDSNNMYQEGVYPKDPKMISRIINCSLGKNNRYLLTDKIMRDSANCFGLIPRLNFKTELEVLWGSEEEIESYLPKLFENLILDILSDEKKYKIQLKEILCDYVPYAKYSTYYEIGQKNNISLLVYYGIHDTTVSAMLEPSKISAIYHLYNKSGLKESFKKCFYNFYEGVLTYTKIDTYMEKNFVFKDLIPLLKEYIPTYESLGLRVKQLILADLSKTKNLLQNHKNKIYDPQDDSRRKLVGITCDYIIKLEKIQKELLSLNSK